MPFPPDLAAEILPLDPKEILQVRERVRGEFLPLFVFKSDEKNLQIMAMAHIPGTPIRVSPEGDIYYPEWRELSWIKRPELYLPCSRVPQGWTFDRLLASSRRPISEIRYHRVTADNGSVWAAIRNMDHVIERYHERGEELGQSCRIEEQIQQVIRALKERGSGLERWQFDEAFEQLYDQTQKVLDEAGLAKARLALKRDIDRLLTQASTGKDRLGRPNPMAMLLKVQAANRRVVYRQNEATLVRSKFETMKTGLVQTAFSDRDVLCRARHDLSTGFASHEAFKFDMPHIRGMQRGILMGMTNELSQRIEKVMVKPYKSTAVGLSKKLETAKTLIHQERCAEAKTVFDQAFQEVDEFLKQDEESSKHYVTQPSR